MGENSAKEPAAPVQSGITGKVTKGVLYFALFPFFTAVLFAGTIKNFNAPLLSAVFGLICFASLVVTGIVFFRQFAIERIFLLFYAFFGLVYLFVLPMMGVPDERNHWLRIFEISEGHLFSDKDNNSLGGRSMPAGLDLTISLDMQAKYSDMSHNFSLMISKDTQQWYEFWNTALYTPVTYIFQIPGVLLGKLLTSRTILVMYVGRVFSFLISLLFLYFALKHLPCRKTMLFVITMMPMFIHQAVSLSGDTAINIISICSIAFVLWSCNTPNDLLGKRHIVLLYFFGLCIALSKIVYFPLVFSFCLIPASKFRTETRRKLFFVLLLAVSFTASVVWFCYITKNYHYVYEGQQITAVLAHPARYAILVIKAYIFNLKWIIGTCLGAHLGWLNIHIGGKALLLYAACLCLTFLYNSGLGQLSEAKNKRAHIVVYGLIIAAVMVSTELSQVTWTPYYADHLTVIQGRYLMPVVFPLCLLLALIAGGIPVTVEAKYRGKILPLDEKNLFRLSLPLLSLVHLLVIKQIMLFCA